MSETAVLEIVELADGEIVLRSAEEEGEPLVRIRFSEEAADLLRRSRFEMAQEMIDHAIARTQLWDGEADAEDAVLKGTLH
ncbi:hypothetical protein SAMN02745148_02676 [Modicisalibacter ilicicola DSM 19980]|uniref:Uncharacterized protein n=1 Tax=Modicisalibacter ilicicola DSM 19980 TaxID=1121942 RepID=A0A1M5BTK9_9GAMM|nr:hypothetical protein [Halomonas ilicicola]SHF45740.1 hypothetical protein SAMN02745148_02676 [Halomonas ilicicola DSM 19980]